MGEQIAVIDKKSAIRRFIQFLGSFHLSVTLLVALLLLTFLGTIEQIDHGLFEVQRRYFESFALIHWVGGVVPLPLPGASLVLSVLAVNLIIGGIIRLRISKMTIGVLIAHLGILLMLAASVVKWQLSTDGHLTLYEGERGDYFESYYLFDLIVAETSSTAPESILVREQVIPHEDFAHLKPGQARRFKLAGLDLEVVISDFAPNTMIKIAGESTMPGESRGREVDGYRLDARERDKEAERNVAGCIVTITDVKTGESGEGLSWGLEIHPLTISVGGRTVTAHLRHRRWPLPFEVVLDDFERELHPGLNLAASFASDITKNEGGTSQSFHISMNAPLRHRGYTLFQSGWGPEKAPPGTRLFSTFSVVQNPSDHWPLYSCIVIGLGLLLHFIQKLWRYQKAEQSRRK